MISKGEYLNPREKRQEEAEENYVTRSYIICNIIYNIFSAITPGRVIRRRNVARMEVNKSIKYFSLTVRKGLFMRRS
jgi:hypothetical protein